MKSMKVKLVVLLLLVGVLSACASPDSNTSASQPTEAAAAATEVLATEAPATEPSAATEAPDSAVENTPTAGVASGSATVSFANDILPLLESRCINCHGGQRTQEGLSLKTHADIMSGSENGPVVTPGDAENSSLAKMVINGKMPKRGPKLTPDQVKLIVDWIDQGAQDN